MFALVGTAACPRPLRQSTDGVTASGTDQFPTDFTPPPPLPPAGPADPTTFGAPYLDLVAARIEPGWTQFLEDCRLRLPPGHPLNSATLEAAVQLIVDSHGAAVTVELVAASGNGEFDDAVVAVTRDAAPFPVAERALLSDDDLVYLTWRFARDRRQAGAATARLTRVEWPLERAVPQFLESGNLAEAARRVGAARPTPVALGFAERVMVAAVREALASPDLAVQRLAVTAAAEAKLATAARELRAIADGSLDVELRGAAIAALAAIGDSDAVPLVTAILERDAGANIELTTAAAHTLATLGEGRALATMVSGWLATGRTGKTPAERSRTWAALLAAAGAPVPSVVPDVGRMVTTGEPRVRAAACRALGTAAVVESTAWKPLGKGLGDADATVRAACATAIATAAGAGGKSRAMFWVVTPLVRDRDERVRAAAVLALGRLDAQRGKADLVAAARDKSPLVQASLAEALVRAGELDRAAALLGAAEAAVRLAAVTALIDHGGAAGAARAAAHVDSDAQVRLRQVAASSDRAQLAALAEDSDPAVAAAALRRLIITSGRGDTVASAAAAIANAAPASTARVQVASAWLAAR